MQIRKRRGFPPTNLAALISALEHFSSLAFSIENHAEQLDFDAILLARPCFVAFVCRLKNQDYALQAYQLSNLQRFIDAPPQNLILTDLQGELFDSLYSVLHRLYPDQDMVTTVLETALDETLY